MKIKFAILLACLAACASAQAQVTLTFNGTADNTAVGFTAGQSVSFAFTVNGSYGGGSQDQFDSTQNYWFEDIPGGSPILTQFSGSGTTGSLTPFSNPSSYTYIYNSPSSPGNSFMEILIWSRDEDNLGVGLGGGMITNVQLSLNESGFEFSYPATYTDPAAYFAGFTGTYTAPAISGSLWIYTTAGDLGLTLTDYSITSGSAIPEPSTYAAFAGLGACLAVAFKRRQVPGLAAGRKRHASAPLSP